MDEEMDKNWQALSEEVLSGMKEWRLAHPKATFREIEQAVEERLNRLKARMLQDAALASQAKDWRDAPEDERPKCPVCRTPLQARGQHSRRLQVTGGHDITLSRTYGTCPTCGTGLFPLDEELVLLPGRLAPSLQDHLTHLASWMPFRRAAQMLTRLLGVQVSETTIRRHTLASGALYEQQQTVESKQPPASAHEPSAASPAAQRLVLSGDGAYVGLIKGEWAEVRTLVIGEVQSSSEPEQEIQTQALSYFSRMTDAATFADLAEVEMRRRGVVQVEQVCVVTDGADWLQSFIDVHRADALRILDFPHAAQRFGMIAEAYAQNGQPLPADWVGQQCHDLKHLGPRVVLERLRALPELAVCAEHLRYLEKREALMQYPTYQAAGWPIGSGIVESGNKVVMQARLKRAGMRWEPTHVNPMLALRTAICNDRWDEAWSAVVRMQSQQLALKRQRLATPRLHSLISSFFLLLLQFRPPTPKPVCPTPSRVVAPAATLPGSSRPSAHHPWKRGPTCRPTIHSLLQMSGNCAILVHDRKPVR